MNQVLIIGSGGREHALAWKFAQSPRVDKVYVAPGNPGMRDVATLVDIAPGNFDALLAFAKEKQIALTFVGPELPLVEGIVDRFTEEGLLIFGPRANAAILEGSKSFAKDLMKKYKIPTARYESFTDYESACRYIETQKPPFVLKADGLAEGKGVVIAAGEEEAKQALSDMLRKGRFGKAGATVLIEEFLEGPEFSFMAFVNGTEVYPMALAKDHKRAYDGDLGPNTGGMGAYAPVPEIDAALIESAKQDILQKTARAMAEEGRPFTGVLYAGLIATKEGPKVIEFNARFGDPETEVVLPLLEGDFYEILMAVLASEPLRLKWSDEHVVGVVLASKGYPGAYEKAAPIEGLEDLEEETLVFHCGTAYRDGGYVTNGGRVLLLARKAATGREAKEKLYAEIAKIKCGNLFYRRDIGGALLPQAKLICRGKTKNVFANTDGTYTLQLKDDATGKDGVFDPGENAVGLRIEGLGRASLKLSRYYFEKLKQAGVPTHYIASDTEAVSMKVLPATLFGRGLEFICRRKAAGSFLKRYGSYVSFGTELGYFVEATLKDDERLDPQITKEALSLLGIMRPAEYEACEELSRRIAKLIAEDLEKKGLELYDIKFEFGKNGGAILLIDEISGGCMRVYKDGAFVQPLELGALILGE